MIVVEYEGVELDHCPSCEGTWFDSDELRLLFEELGSEAALRIPADIQSLPEVEIKEARRRCPICRRRMRKVSIPCAPDVLLDACAQGDGIWFDRSEVYLLAREHRQVRAGRAGAGDGVHKPCFPRVR